MILPTRKANRLREYDYAQNGIYFVTICTKDKKKILCSIVGDDAHIVPSRCGKVVLKYIKSIPGVVKYVMMPNHIHLLIAIDNGPMWASAPTPSISTRVRSFKTLVTKELGESIFQRSFHDHVVRGEEDYRDIWHYIEHNPQQWQEDCFFVEG